MDEAVSDRVGMLCDQLSRWPELATTIRDGGAQAQLAELLTLLAGRSAPDDRRVSALIDAIEDACARQGLPGLTRRLPSLPPGLGTARRTPQDGEPAGWTCPLDRCSRVVLPEETPSAPICAAHGEDARMRPYRPRPR
ncbi:hypothetical protein ABZX95_14655 [Streptomyces sp. NPDC004232]|uniref:hypothetical protein n=1 Tax=Streptomyces sp. NPDC004232 TaxID=3154454 RepID=UPI0033B76D30